MLRTPPPALRRAVGAVKLGVACTVAFVAAGPVLTSAPTAADYQGPTAADVSAQARLDALMAAHDCSRSGFGSDVVPGSALIERDDEIQHVSFDDGWAVYEGDATGALLAVCRGSL